MILSPKIKVSNVLRKTQDWPIAYTHMHTHIHLWTQVHTRTHTHTQLNANKDSGTWRISIDIKSLLKSSGSRKTCTSMGQWDNGKSASRTCARPWAQASWKSRHSPACLSPQPVGDRDRRVRNPRSFLTYIGSSRLAWVRDSREMKGKGKERKGDVFLWW